MCKQPSSFARASDLHHKEMNWASKFANLTLGPQSFDSSDRELVELLIDVDV